MDNLSAAIETARVKLPNIRYSLDEPMKNHTSFKIGASLRAMFFPGNAKELVELCKLLHENEVTPLIFGNGTNLLADDSKPLGIIAIKTKAMDYVEQTGEEELTAGAGISLPKLAEFACELGLTGLEFAHGIPGSLGGAVSINAGAYGAEMRDVVYSTSALSLDVFSHSHAKTVKGIVATSKTYAAAYTPNTAGVYTVFNAEHDFSYRYSRFSESGDIVLASFIRLHRGDKARIKAKMDELYSRRRESQPLDLPSAGSTFKRPKEGYAAELIEQAGLKGFAIGGAMVSEKHAGFVVNMGSATYSDVMAVIEHVRSVVYERFGVELEQENKIVFG